ncbi:mediator of DNA damage checkpoint protein 1 isoform X2 [Eucyclogobius newberryi]|uniref:mediator of DNA damage checkpoint protein 1 isoform X2 n=1 Tax=Eucyclogobius newberryi TaxID=166745 RepID=UPI003B598FCE
MDATQMMNDSVLEEEEDEEEEEDDRGAALGKLCVLKNPHVPEKECHLYLGENVLGRDPDACSMSFLAPSVSKQHATIALSVYRRKGRQDEVEALLWDMGSMNGTRKGHLKLTPNVRYALSEGDSVVLADIPCKYTKGARGTRTPGTPNLDARDVLRENGGHLRGNKAKSPAGAAKRDGLADAEGARGTPARTGALSLEQTPTQPQPSLAPDSESESEEAGDRRPKAAVSDSDSHKSSPICSTFTSPTNEVVPESEDESPITPSSSYKNRTRRVSFSAEESDGDIGRRGRDKTAALDVVDDSEEETGSDGGGAQPERSKVEPDAGVRANATSEFNTDSDTDVEEEEEKLIFANGTAAAVMSSDAQATNKPEFHMDSDTDVEDDNDSILPDHAVSSDNVPKESQAAPVPQPNVISMDSDTDVEEDEASPAAAAPPETSTGVRVSSTAAEFNVDSDTDVEDELLVSAAKAVESQTASRERPETSADPDDFNVHSDTDDDDEEGETDITPATPSRLDAKSLTSKSATPRGVEYDSDTDDEGILGVPVSSKPPVDLEILSNSDTDVEDDSPDVKPASSGLIAADREVDSAAGTGVNESVAAASEDSDTDVEDNEAEFKETEDDEMPVLRREITPGVQGVLLQNCSTPIQVGNVDELETQAFLSPSISAYRSAVAPRTSALSSCSSQEDDYAVAETQSFVLHDKARDPNVSLGSSANENDAPDSSGGQFRLELSDSSALQRQALAMESTQAFINANLEETQPYADACVTDKKNATVDIALQATQAYLDLQNSDDDDEEEDGQEEEEEEEATQPLDDASVAPTQPTCGDSENSARAFRQETAKQIQEEETQRFTDVTVAATQPTESQDGGETDEDSAEIEEETRANADVTEAQAAPMETPADCESDEDSAVVFRKKEVSQIQGEETQRNSDLIVAQTVPMEMEDTEESDDDGPVFRKKKVTQIQEEASQQKSDLIVAQTVPMETEDMEESDDDGPVFRKRTAKRLQSEEEATQSIETLNDEETDDEEDSAPMFRKRKAKRIATIEDTQPSLESELAVAPTQPIPVTEERTAEDAIPVGRRRTTRKRKEEVNSELAPTQPVVSIDDGESDEEIVAPRKRKARKLEDTQSLNSQETNNGGEASGVGVRARRCGRRLAKEKQAEEEVEPTKRVTKGKSKVAQVSKGRRGRAKVEPAEESDEEEEQEVTKMSTKLLTEKEQNETGKRGEREEKERLEKERIEQEETVARIQKEKDEKEMMERQKKDREEKEKLEKEREEMERLEKERVERAKKELAAKQRKEKERDEAERREKLENERLENERIKREKKELAAKEKEEKKQKEKLEKSERLEHEKRAREEREKVEKEQKERAARDGLEAAKKQEEELQRQQEDEAPRRGRRTGRRTIAVPDSSSTVADEDDVPAKRTRSRSNSSNSVCSERSASSNVSQASSRGRGRGRGARRTEVQVETTPSRGRRRTVASAPSPPRTLSQSSSNASEFSASSVSSQGRGRGGRQRGRGRKTEIECANERASTKRGRKRTCTEEEEGEGDDSQASSSTRGRRGATEDSSNCADEEGEDASANGTEGRGGRIKRVEAKKESGEKTLEVEENGEDEDASSSGKRKAAGRNTPARKMTKVAEDDGKNGKAKGKSRAATVPAKNSEKPGDVSSSSANNSMEQEEEPPQTLRSSVSRKRSSADSESDSLPKTPRSSTASPSAVFASAASPRTRRSSTASPSAGRARTATQAYKVLFTGVVDEDGENVLTRLGGAMAEDVADMNCLVTDKVRRTVKFLCAVAKGIPIVTTRWLEKSGKAGAFLPPHTFLVKDREQENKFDFNLQESLRAAGGRPLLQGYGIHVTKSVKPEPDKMKDIISCSGAVFLPKMPSSNKPNTVVVSCEEDRSLCAAATSRGLPVVSSEFILTGILRQKLDLEAHKLDGPATAPTAGGRGRGRKKK